MPRLRVDKPCSADWDAMPGDERVRHCTLCDLDVFNFASMTPVEVDAIVANTKGRLCGRLKSAAAVAAMVGLSAFASACTTSKPVSEMTLDVSEAAQQDASLTGVVTEATGVTLPGVTVIARDEATAQERVVITDVNGAFAIPSLREGVYRIEASLEGLGSVVREHVALKRGETARAQVTLRFDVSETIIVGAIAVDDLNRNALATTIGQDALKYVPH